MITPWLILIWGSTLLWGGKYAGFSPEPIPLQWHPAHWVARAVCSQPERVKGGIGVLILFVAAIVIPEGTFSLITILLLAPLPILLLDVARRDAALFGTDYVFFNPFLDVSEQSITETSNARQTEIFQTVYLFISQETWEQLLPLMDDTQQSYLANKRVVGSLFRAEVDPDFMGFYDSMRLSRFIVHSGSEEAMGAFCRALKAEMREQRKEQDANFESDLEPVGNEPTLPNATDDNPAQPQYSGSLVDAAFVTGVTAKTVNKAKGKKLANPKAHATDINDDILDSFIIPTEDPGDVGSYRLQLCQLQPKGLGFKPINLDKIV